MVIIRNVATFAERAPARQARASAREIPAV
jgi:hypothetical protein